MVRSLACTVPGSTLTSAHKAPVEQPRKAMGNLLGNGVRIGKATNPAPREGGGARRRRRARDHAVAACGAARSADGRGALRQPSRRADRPSETPPPLHRRRCRRGRRHGIRTSLPTAPRQTGSRPFGCSREHGDFNEDLCALGIDELRSYLRPQLSPADVDRLAAIVRRLTDKAAGSDAASAAGSSPGSMSRAFGLPRGAIGAAPARAGNGCGVTVFRRRTAHPTRRAARGPRAPTPHGSPRGDPEQRPGFASRGKTAPPPPSSADAAAARQARRCRPGPAPALRRP